MQDKVKANGEVNTLGPVLARKLRLRLYGSSFDQLERLPWLPVAANWIFNWAVTLSFNLSLDLSLNLSIVSSGRHLPSSSQSDLCHTQHPCLSMVVEIELVGWLVGL